MGLNIGPTMLHWTSCQEEMGCRDEGDVQAGLASINDGLGVGMHGPHRQPGESLGHNHICFCPFRIEYKADLDFINVDRGGLFSQMSAPGPKRARVACGDDEGWSGLDRAEELYIEFVVLYRARQGVEFVLFRVRFYCVAGRI